MSERKKAIAIVSPGGFGTGANNLGIPVLEEIVNRLKEDYDVTVFQFYKMNADYHYSGFKLISIHHKSPVVRAIRFLKLFRIENKLSSFTAVHGMWTLPCGLLAVVAAKMAGITSVVSVLGGDAVSLPEIGYGRLRTWLGRRLVLWTLRKANYANALTTYLVNNLYRAGFDSRIDVIPWGVDSKAFAPAPGHSSSEVKFLHVANLHPVKDQVTLLRTVDLIRKDVSCKLTIIGRGSEQDRVLRLIDELKLGDVVTVLPPVEYHQLAGYYQSHDILLHTSLSEGQSEVVTEALSCGMLVCGTRVGLIHDLEQICPSVSPRDFNGLARAVLTVLKDSNQMNSRRQQGRAWCLAHDISWTVNQYKTIYNGK